MRSSNDPTRDVIAEQAAEWYVTNRSGSADHETRATFVAWLKASPVNVEEYLGVTAIAASVTSAAVDPEFDLDALVERARHSDTVVAVAHAPSHRARQHAPTRRTRAWSRIAIAASLLIGVATSVIWSTRDGERWDLPRTYRSARGATTVQQLPDGSTVHLDTDSQVTVRYSRGERLVDLDRGQAVFQVAHEGLRRFRVVAGAAQVIAVGTRFDVYRRAGSVTVAVVEGTVAVRLSPTTVGSLGDAPAEQEVRVGAGYEVDVREQLAVPRRSNIKAATAWLKGQIVFRDRALGEVAAEFNRYGSVPLEIDDQSLRAVLISGVFDAYDTDSFAAFLQTLGGVVVEKTPSRIRVRSIAAGNREPLSVAR